MGVSRMITVCRAVRYSAVVASIAALGLGATADRAGAQQMSDTQVAAQVRSCPYDECALRLQSTFWGGMRVVQGVRTDSVAHGPFGGGLVRAVRGVPMAEREAAMGRSQALKAAAWIVPTLLVGSGMVVAGARDGREDRGLISLGILVSAVGGSIGGYHQRKSENHFSRAVWQYNRELAR